MPLYLAGDVRQEAGHAAYLRSVLVSWLSPALDRVYRVDLIDYILSHGGYNACQDAYLILTRDTWYSDRKFPRERLSDVFGNTACM